MVDLADLSLTSDCPLVNPADLSPAEDGKVLKAVVVTLEGEPVEEILLEELSIFPVRSPHLHQQLALASASLLFTVALALALTWVSSHLLASLRPKSGFKFSSWILCSYGAFPLLSCRRPPPF